MSDENKVVPIAPISQCASCGATVKHDERFKLEAHDERCMQPEIRFKRLERGYLQLQEVVHQLVASNNDTVTNQIDLHKRLEQIEQHPERLGSSEKHAERRVELLEGKTEKAIHRLAERVLALEEKTNGTSEAIPDTQRSGIEHTGIHDAGGWCYGCDGCKHAAAHPGEPCSDAGATEP